MTTSPSTAGRGHRAPGPGRGTGALWWSLPVGALLGAALALALDVVHLDAPRALVLPAAGALVGVGAALVLRAASAPRLGAAAATLRALAASLATPAGGPAPTTDPVERPRVLRRRTGSLTGVDDVSAAAAEIAAVAAGRQADDAVVDEFCEALRGAVSSPRWGDAAAAALARALPSAGTAVVLQTRDGLHVLGARGIAAPGALAHHPGIAAAVAAHDATRCDASGVRRSERGGPVEDLIVCPARDGQTVGALVAAGQELWRPGTVTLLNRLAAVWARAQSVAATFDRVRGLAAVDPATGAYDQDFAHRRLREELHRARRSGYQLGLVLFDLDAFSLLNDQHGRDLGDRILRLVAAAATATVRMSDVVARIGDDEFLVLAPDVTADGLERLGERIRVAVEGVQLRDRSEMARVTATVGVALSAGAARDQERRLLEESRRAVEAAKIAGGNRVATLG